MARPAHAAGRSRSTTESSTSPPAFVTGTGRVADRRGVDPPSPQTGDSLWKVGRDPLTGVGPAMEGTSGAAERALLRGRAGEAALSCESSRQRAPGRAGARAPGQRGGFVAGGQTNSRRRRRLRAADRHEPTTRGVRAERVGAKRSPRAVVVDGVIQRRNTSSLQKTPDPRDLDWPIHESGHRPSAARHPPQGGRGSKPKGFDLRGARGASLGSEMVARVTSSTGSRRKPRARQPGGQLHQRATAGAVLRSSVSVVVLADRIGCRSRQAARGHSRPCAKSAWTTRDGLASGRESAHEVKERRKPARPWQSGGNGGGLSTFIGNGGRESALQRAPVDGRRLGPNQVVRFDERAMDAVLVFVARGMGAIPSHHLGKPRTAGTTGDVRGRSRSFIGEDNAPVRRAPVTGSPDASILERGRSGKHRAAAG